MWSLFEAARIRSDPRILPAIRRALFLSLPSVLFFFLLLFVSISFSILPPRVSTNVWSPLATIVRPSGRVRSPEGASGFAYHCIGAYAMNFMGVTCAAFVAQKGIIPPRRWQLCAQSHGRKICSGNMENNKAGRHAEARRSVFFHDSRNDRSTFDSAI